MYEIGRELSFCYGHRLMNYDGKCARLHGHNAVAVVNLRGSDLDAAGMVVDFQMLRDRVGTWIETQLDHRMILRHDDPVLPALQALGEPVCVVDWNPTAENLARLLFDVTRDAGLPVVSVDLWETPTCKATYRP